MKGRTKTFKNATTLAGGKRTTPLIEWCKKYVGTLHCGRTVKTVIPWRNGRGAWFYYEDGTKSPVLKP